MRSEGMGMQKAQIMKTNKKILLLLTALVLSLITIKTVLAYNEITEQRKQDIAIKEATRAQEEVKTKLDSMSIQELIDYIAPQYGQDSVLIKKVVWCESGFNPNAIHDGVHGRGVTGFHKNTFNSWKIRFNRPELKYESNFDQITLMSLAFSKGEGYRDDWTTYVAYTRGGTYTFYSNLMKKTYTVVCK